VHCAIVKHSGTMFEKICERKCPKWVIYSLMAAIREKEDKVREKIK
jgi:hypothetical protein